MIIFNGQKSINKNMINFVKVALIWGLPAIMVNKLVFYTIYKVGGSHECIVDVAYSISHLVAGVVYYVFSTAPVAGKIVFITSLFLRLILFLSHYGH
jgi:hypothetical protein